jgi:hypothetical protein
MAPFEPIPDEVREQLVGPVPLTEGGQNAVWREWSGKFSDALGGLLDIPPPGPQYRVLLQLVYKDLVYGSDMGILTILDGGLEFHGMRTDFSLSRAKTKLKGESPTCENGSTQIELRFKTVVDVVVLLKPLGVKASQASATCQEIYQTLLNWQLSAASEEWTEAVGPPTGTQEKVLRDAKDKVIMWQIGFGFVAFLGFLMVAVGDRDPSLNLLTRGLGLLIAFCCYGFWAQSKQAAEKLKVLKSMELIASGPSRTKRRAGALR